MRYPVGQGHGQEDLSNQTDAILDAMSNDGGFEHTARLRAAMPFATILGIDIVAASAEEVAARCEWQIERTTTGGVVHGGYLMAVADSLGALLAFLNMAEGATTSTIESKTNFFKPIVEGRIEFRATPLSVGRRIVVVQIDATRTDGALAARTTQTQLVIV